MAGDLAEVHGLCGYDAVHLAAARSVADDELVLELAAVATALGLTVA